MSIDSAQARVQYARNISSCELNTARSDPGRGLVVDGRPEDRQIGPEAAELFIAFFWKWLPIPEA
jgi:hypothetical protein